VSCPCGGDGTVIVAISGSGRPRIGGDVPNVLGVLGWVGALG